MKAQASWLSQPAPSSWTFCKQSLKDRTNGTSSSEESDKCFFDDAFLALKSTRISIKMPNQWRVFIVRIKRSTHSLLFNFKNLLLDLPATSTNRIKANRTNGTSSSDSSRTGAFKDSLIEFYAT
jgi:hypothetical protein